MADSRFWFPNKHCGYTCCQSVASTSNFVLSLFLSKLRDKHFPHLLVWLTVNENMKTFKDFVFFVMTCLVLKQNLGSQSREWPFLLFTFVVEKSQNFEVFGRAPTFISPQKKSWQRPVPSLRGGFGGLSTSKQSSKSPQVEIWNTIS